MAQRKVSAVPSTDRSVPRPLGPDSQTWRDFGSYRFHMMLSQAFVLQSAHPIIDAGVGAHSTYRTDPWGRARRSTRMLWPVVYARPEVAIRKGRELRELHKAIRGVDKAGNKYHALDPEAYAWVHITGFDASVRMHELFGRPLTPEKRAKMFKEWQDIGTMLGIKEKDIPATEEEYWKHFDSMIEDRLIFGDVVQDLLSDRYFFEQPKPPIEKLPDFAWKLSMKIIGRLLKLNTLGTLPPRFRERFDIPWSARQERLFRLHCALFKVLWGLLPEDMKYIPMARRAFKDARENPEAYAFDAASAAAPAAGPTPAPA